MSRMSELSDQEFFKTMINVLRDLVEKIDNIQKKKANVS